MLVSHTLMADGRAGGDIQIDPSRISAEGGPDYPLLVVPLDNDLHPLGPADGSGMPYTILNASCELYVADQTHRLSEATAVTWAPQRVTRVNTAAQYTFEFPLDERRIHRIEELRDGGDLRLKLEVCFTLLLHPLVARVMEDGLLRSPHRPVAGVTEDVRLEPHIHFANATFHIEVAQSDWIKAVLPGLGYDRIQLIEVPRLGAEAGDFAKSVQALKRANEYFLRGDYGASVGDCRLAIEPIRKDLDLRGRKDCSPKLLALLTDKEESDFLEGIGTATGDWRLAYKANQRDILTHQRSAS